MRAGSRDSLNQVERDLVEFLAERRGAPEERVRRMYLDTRARFGFAGIRYRQLCDDVHQLNRILYDDVTDEDVVESQRFHELMHLFRFVASSYSRTRLDDVRDAAWLVARGQVKQLYAAARKRVAGNEHGGPPAPAARDLLAALGDARPVVLDYGCGLAYVSFEIARRANGAKVFLLDVDCLHLDFAHYRFRTHGVDVEAIRVTAKDLYPSLPPHTICIATEVMEHVTEPLRVFENVDAALATGGLLYGNFEDHHHEMFHVSPDLGGVRKELAKGYEPAGDMIWRKRR